MNNCLKDSLYSSGVPPLFPSTAPVHRTGFASWTDHAASHATSTHLSEVVIKSLECVADEWQAHLWRLLNLVALLDSLCLEDSGVIGLINFISREISRVDVGGQARLEGCADTAQAIKLNTAEESMTLDFVGTATAETVLCVTDHAAFC